jgi:hypothetical protein
MLRDIIAAHIVSTRVNLTAPSLEYVPKYFEMGDGMEGMQREIVRLESAEEEIQAIL